MTGMTMPQQTWYGAAAGYLGMWMAMMVPMMLPSLVPMLSRYRRSVRGADGIHLHGLTALVGVGYFVIWAVLGAAAYAAGAGVMAVEMRWGMVAHKRFIICSLDEDDLQIGPAHSLHQTVGSTADNGFLVERNGGSLGRCRNSSAENIEQSHKTLRQAAELELGRDHRQLALRSGRS